MNPYARCFQQALGLGMSLNAAMIVSLSAAPSVLLRAMRIPPPDPIWVRTVMLLLGLITVAYLPALLDPLRYRAVALYTLLVRVAGIVFFGGAVVLGVPRGFVLFAAYDAIFVTLQGALLWLALRREGLIPRPLVTAFTAVPAGRGRR